MSRLSAVFLGWLQAAICAIVVALVSLRNAWLTLTYQSREGLSQLGARHPRCKRWAQALFRAGRPPVGSSPSLPTSLGVVLAQQLSGVGGAGGDLAQLAMLITWAQQQGMQEVFLYDPRGWLQRRCRLLEKEVERAQGGGSSSAGSRLRGGIAFHVGWPAVANLASGQQHQQGLPHLGQQPLATSAQQRRRGEQLPPWPASSREPEEGDEMQVVILSAVDSHYPLEAAARAAAAAAAAEPAGEVPCPAILGGEAAVAVAAAAAAATKGHAAAGIPAAPAAHGFPGRAPAGGLSHPAHAAASYEVSHVGSSVGSEAGGEGLGGQLERAVAAPARLRSRLQQAAGPLAGSEPDLMLVFGEVLTLAGYPPWAVRVSEIYHAGLLQRLRRADLQRTLRQYLGTKQRFGT